MKNTKFKTEKVRADNNADCQQKRESLNNNNKEIVGVSGSEVHHYSLDDTLILGQIYTLKKEITEHNKDAADAYVYIRFLREDELGFSTLDDPLLFPDFSGCTVFWVRFRDFTSMFELYDGHYYKDIDDLLADDDEISEEAEEGAERNAGNQRRKFS